MTDFKRQIAFLALAGFMWSLSAQSFDYVFIPGTGSTFKDSNGVLKSDMKTPFEESLAIAYGRYAELANQVVIGHSQGGMRAAAYANELLAKGKGANLKALITIGAPTRGFTPLTAGPGTLLQKAVYSGDRMVKAIISIPALGFGLAGLGTEGHWTTALGQAIYAISGVTSLLPLETWTWFLEKCGIVQADDMVVRLIRGEVNAASGFMTPEVLRDFSPGSDYVANRLVPKETPTEIGTETVKVLTGYRQKAIRIRGPDGWEYDTIEVPVCEYVTRTIYGTPAFTKRLPDSAYVGIIYGNEADPLEAIEDAVEGFAATDARDALTATAWIFGTVGAAHTLMGVGYTLSAISTFVLNPIGGIVFAGMAISAGTHAYSAFYVTYMCANFKDYYNKTFLGTSKSDGLIPYESLGYMNDNELDYLEKKLGGQSITEPGERYWAETPCNHSNECSHPLIWGEGGGLWKKKVMPGGIIHEWLLNRSLYEVTPATFLMYDKE